MKTAAIFLAAAALASAQAPPEGTNKVNCAKPNANYCLSGDIIIRCDANGMGTAGRCSDNVAGYPPLGGVAECWQSSTTSGDAACQKNCVVYAQPSAFTLPASQCQPSAVITATGTGTPTTLETAVTSAPQTSAPAGTDTVVYTTTVVNGTVTLTVPCTTAEATSVTGIVIPPPDFSHLCCLQLYRCDPPPSPLSLLLPALVLLLLLLAATRLLPPAPTLPSDLPPLAALPPSLLAALLPTAPPVLWSPWVSSLLTCCKRVKGQLYTCLYKASVLESRSVTL
ncbi:uncharacterized protein TrAtP1_000166 [Trichoderma atroviride]|uniref:uncharacterized protein n=1 Tax=Hypocrea atroviridis TaxID=63577 RepID=UPI00332E6F88|nr:hypothetical protein TrAtP1_000166 [Trichoderma atroviride]